MNKRSFLSRYIGDKAYYSMVLALIVPIIIQNGISNFVNLLDNLMVGAAGQNQMNGVSISNNLFFVFNLCVFGGMSGATIFAAQFYGAHDIEGVKHTFRFSLIVGAVVSAAALVIIGFFREQLISLWINIDPNAPDYEQLLKDAEETLEAGKQYSAIILLSLVPYALTNAYAGVLRTCGETKLPMYASVAGVITNCVLNYILIFGYLGFPAMQAKGAAIATVISRYVEVFIIVIVSHKRGKTEENYRFLVGAYRDFKIPKSLLKTITVKGSPLLLNECLWSLGMTMLSNQYSMKGLVVVAAVTINSTISNLFNVFFISMGTASAVLVGRSLGANDADGARDNARKIIVFEEFICIATCAVLLLSAGILPNIYTKTTLEARALASRLIRVSALALPLSGFAHCTYFTLRAGGKTFITFLFDSVYTWVCPVPLAWALVRFTSLDIVAIFAMCNFIEIVKDVFGYILLKKGVWIHNIVE